MSRLGPCRARISGDRQTHRQTDTHTQTHKPSTATLAAHVRLGLTSLSFTAAFAQYSETKGLRTYYPYHVLCVQSSFLCVPSHSPILTVLELEHIGIRSAGCEGVVLNDVLVIV